PSDWPRNRAPAARTCQSPTPRPYSSSNADAAPNAQIPRRGRIRDRSLVVAPLSPEWVLAAAVVTDRSFFQRDEPISGIFRDGFFRIWIRETSLKAPFDIAGDLDTPVSAFMKLAAFRPCFLLESVEGGERLGRYSFIGFGDGLEIRLDRQGLTIGAERRPVPASAAELL